MKPGKGINNYAEVAALVKEVPGVETTTPFVYSEAMITTGRAVTGVILLGIDPITAPTVINLNETLIQGSLAGLSELDTDRSDVALASLPGIIVGKELARNLSLYYCDEITVLSPLGEETPMGMVPKVKKFRVCRHI